MTKEDLIAKGLTEEQVYGDYKLSIRTPKRN